MASSSLCPHLLQEYFKRVNEITEVYTSQIIKFVKYEDVSGLLLNRRILKHEEHAAISQLLSNDIQMSTILQILLRRMWGLENLITVLIEINVDSWLVNEMFEKYVHHVVNEVRRLQAQRSCRCFENERRSFIRKAAIRFFQMCDGWLFSIGTSLGCLTQTIYPTHNSLQFINDLLPIPRETDDVVILPRIESIPFDYSYAESDQGVLITEVYSDAEKSSTTPKSIEGVKLSNGTLKKTVVSPTKSSERNGSVSSPSSPRFVSARKPSSDNEIKVRASLAKTSHGKQKVVPRDLISSAENRTQRGMRTRVLVTNGLTLDEDDSEEESEVFQYRAEAMALVPLQMESSDYHMTKPRPELTDLTELPENCFVFSPIPVLRNLHDTSSSDALKSGFQSTIAALPLHDNLLYSAYPFHSFGEVEKRFGTFSSSSISQTNGSSQELSSILSTNFDRPNHINSIHRSISIPAIRNHLFDVNNPYLSTISIPEESGEIIKPGVRNSSKKKVLQVESTGTIDAIHTSPITLPKMKVKTNEVNHKNQVTSVGHSRASSRSSSGSNPVGKEALCSTSDIGKSKNSTSLKPTSKSGVATRTKKPGYLSTVGRSRSIGGISANSRVSLKNTTPRNSTVKKPETRLPTETIEKSNEKEKETICILSNQHTCDEANEIPSDLYQTEAFATNDISAELPNESTFSLSLSSQGTEDKIKLENYPSIQNNTAVEKSFIAYDKATWVQQEYDRTLDPSSSGSCGSDDSLMEIYSSRSDSISPEFFNTKINWDEKIYPETAPDQDLNSNLILRGVLEDDPILENIEIFSEDSVSGSTANLGVIKTEAVGTANLGLSSTETLSTTSLGVSSTKILSTVNLGVSNTETLNTVNLGVSNTETVSTPNVPNQEVNNTESVSTPNQDNTNNTETVIITANLGVNNTETVRTINLGVSNTETVRTANLGVSNTETVRTANLGVSNTETVSLPVDKQPGIGKELLTMADPTAETQTAGRTKTLKTQTELVSRKGPSSSATVSKVSMLNSSSNVGKLKEKDNGSRIEVKPVKSLKSALPSPGKNSTSTKAVKPKTVTKVDPSKPSVRRTLFPDTPTSPKTLKASVGHKPKKVPQTPAKLSITVVKKEDAILNSPVKIDRISLEIPSPLPSSNVLNPTQKMSPETCLSPHRDDKVKSIPDLSSAKSQGAQQSKVLQRAFSDTNLLLTKDNAVSKIRRGVLAEPKMSKRCSSNSLNRSFPDVKFHPVTVESGSILDPKSFTDASSQTTVLKKNALSPTSKSASIAKPVNSPTNAMRSTGTQRRAVSTPPKTVAAKGKDTLSGSTSPISESSSKSSSKHIAVTPTKPAWNNKKPAPTPLVLPERFSPFSIEDYNFQQWANEWATRQEKKKTEA